MKHDATQLSQKTVRESGVDVVMGLLCAKLEALHVPPKVGEDDGAFALMHISWELAMRIRSALGLLPDPV